jgi:hypothetical protein
LSAPIDLATTMEVKLLGEDVKKIQRLFKEV